MNWTVAVLNGDFITEDKTSRRKGEGANERERKGKERGRKRQGEGEAGSRLVSLIASRSTR